MKRSLRKLMELYAAGEVDLDTCLQTVNSYYGLLKHGDNLNSASGSRTTSFLSEATKPPEKGGV
jgi:hypothetical protein